MQPESASADTDWRVVLCEDCGSEGRIYVADYYGNEPGERDIGECLSCEGTGGEVIRVYPLDGIEDMEEVPAPSCQPY